MVFLICKHFTAIDYWHRQVKFIFIEAFEMYTEHHV